MLVVGQGTTWRAWITEGLLRSAERSIRLRDARLLSVGDCAPDAVTNTHCVVQGRLGSSSDTLLACGWLESVWDPGVFRPVFRF